MYDMRCEAEWASDDDDGYHVCNAVASTIVSFPLGPQVVCSDCARDPFYARLPQRSLS